MLIPFHRRPRGKQPPASLIASPKRGRRKRLRVECLEERRLLAGDGVIQGIVFHDTNQNGTQDATEVGVANVSVYLDLNDNELRDLAEPEATTNAVGEYRFENLDAGNYVVRQVLPSSASQTSPYSAEDYLYAFDNSSSVDLILQLNPSNGSIVRSIRSPTSLNATSVGLAFDGHSIFLADAITDSVYEVDPLTGKLIDSDLISKDIDGAAALGGSVYLSNPFSNKIFVFDPVSDTITNDFVVTRDGAPVDIVGGLAAIENPNQLVATTATNEVVFIDPATGAVQNSFVHGGQIDVGAAVIGQSVYLSYAGPEFKGIVELSRDGGFLNSFSVSRFGNDLVVRAMDGKRVIDSAHRVALAGGETASQIDFGRFDIRGELGGTQFVDRNGDGERGVDEGPLVGVTVYLDLNDNGQLDPDEPTTVTDSAGAYLFTQLLPGDYVVREVAPERFSQTSPTTSVDYLFGIRHGVSPDTIFRIDPQTGSVISQFSPVSDVTTFRVGLAFDGHSIFVVNENSTQIVELDPVTGDERGRLTIGPGNYDGLASLNGLLYVSDYVADDILVIDPATGDLVRTLDINGLNDKNIVGGLAAIANPDALVATTGSNQVIFIDPVTGIVQSEFIHNGGNDQGVAVLGDEVLLSYTNTFTGISAFERDGTFKRSFTTLYPFYGLDGKQVTDTAHRVSLGEAGSILSLDFGNLPLNQVPVADAGGPYSIDEGDGVTLDASMSSDGDNDTLEFLWDLDQDGEFDDAVGASPTLSATELAALGIADDGTYPIFVQVDDGFDRSIATSNIVVSNVAPTLVVNPLVGLGTKLEPANVSDFLELSGTVADAGSLDELTLVIDWGEIADDAGNADQDRTTFTFAPGDTLEFDAAHQFGSGGIFQVTVTLQDDDGGIVVDSSIVYWVSGVRLDPNQDQLQIVGTNAQDLVRVELDSRSRRPHHPASPSVNVSTRTNAGSASLSSAYTFLADEIQSLRVVLGDGNDHFALGKLNDPTWYVSAVIEGNAGDDHLSGGSGADLILGGDGNDKIDGNNGHDLLIGGNGKDKLHGGKGDDLMIGDTLQEESDMDALDTALASWQTGDLSATLLALDTILSDGEKDNLKGDQGINLSIEDSD